MGLKMHDNRGGGVGAILEEVGRGRKSGGWPHTTAFETSWFQPDSDSS